MGSFLLVQFTDFELKKDEYGINDLGSMYEKWMIKLGPSIESVQLFSLV